MNRIRRFLLLTLPILLTGALPLVPAGLAQTTAPRLAEVPDLRSLDGAPLDTILDLNDFAADFDDTAFLSGASGLTFSATRTGAAPAFSLPQGVLSTDAGAVGDTGTYLWEARDGSAQSATGVSHWRATSALGLHPSPAYDALLSPFPGRALYTYVLDAPATAGAVRTSATGAAAILGTGGPSWDATTINAAYNASLQGTYSPRATLASGTGTVSIPGLEAGIDSSGTFTFAATGSGLSEPVLVGFRGEVSGSGDYAAVSALVSNALLSLDRGISPAAPALAIDDGFETAVLGEIARTGFNGLGMPPNRREGPAENTWVNNVNISNSISAGRGYVSALVIAESDLPAELQDHDFPGDHSGQVLQIRLQGQDAANSAFLIRNAPVPAEAGYAYAVQMSLATDAATAADLPNFRAVLTTFGYTEIAASNYGASGSGAGGSAPTLGDGWIRIRTYLEPTAAGITDITPGGLTAAMILTNPGPDPVNVYVDNVSIFKTLLPNDTSFGTAPVAYAGRPDVMVGNRLRPYVDPVAPGGLGGTLFDGSFETAAGPVLPNAGTTGANANGWFHTTSALPAGVTASVGPGAAETRLEAADANWLIVEFNNPSAPVAPQIRTRLLSADSIGNPFIPGIYVLSLDYITLGPQTPATGIGVSDNGFTNYAYYTLATGTNGAVRRVRIPVTLRDVDNLVFLVVPTAATGETTSAAFDNVTLERVADPPTYWDESLVN